nr:PREDICTED: protein LURP-one-related 15-like [Daucus carota subsp. sativus]
MAIGIREHIVLSLHRRWEVYRGNRTDSHNILFIVKKSDILQLKTELEVFLASNTFERHYDFKIKGSWFEKACTIYAGNSSNVS